MNGPPVSPDGFVTTPVRSVSATGYTLMCDWYIDTALTSERMSAWALAIRDRAVTLAYSGTAIEARTPMIATTIISSISVKPRAFHRVDFITRHRYCSDGAKRSKTGTSPVKLGGSGHHRSHEAVRTVTICQAGDGKRQSDGNRLYGSVSGRRPGTADAPGLWPGSGRGRWDRPNSGRSATLKAGGPSGSRSSSRVRSEK